MAVVRKTQNCVGTSLTLTCIGQSVTSGSRIRGFHSQSVEREKRTTNRRTWSKSGGKFGVQTQKDPASASAAAGLPTTATEKFVVRVQSLAGDELAKWQNAPTSWTCQDVIRELSKQQSLPGDSSYNLLSENTIVRTDCPVCQYRNDTNNVIEFTAVVTMNIFFEALANARKFANKLDGKDLVEMACKSNVPESIALVCTAVCCVLDEHHSQTWEAVSRTISKSDFVPKLEDFDPGVNTRRVMDMLSPYIDNDMFDPVPLKTISLSASMLCSWCREIHLYCKGAENMD